MVVQIDCEHCGRLYVRVDELKLIDIMGYSRACFDECKNCDESEELLEVRGIPACPICACANIKHRFVGTPGFIETAEVDVNGLIDYFLWSWGWFGEEKEEG
jgi:hypothetical protein